MSETFRTSIATVCLSGTLAEKLRAAADAGFDGVEIFEQDLVVSPHSPEQIRQRAADLGLSLDLYQPFRDLDGVTEDLIQENLRRLEVKCQVMNRLGIRDMLVCSNVGTATIDDDALCAEQLRRAGDVAERYGVRLAYEALAWGRYVNTYEHSWRIVKAADHPAVGLCLDSFHILSRGCDPAGIRDIPGEKIFFLQLADAPAKDMDVLSWSRHLRVFPGEGEFALAEFLGHVVATGYQGPLSLEIFNDSFREAEVLRTAIDGLRSLRWLADGTRRLMAAHAQDTLAHRLGLLPPAPTPTTFDFLELHTGRLGEVTQMLHQLGFQLTGFHHSKRDVQVWLHGTARIVIKDEGPTGTDTVLAGMGAVVNNAAEGARRARGLMARDVPRIHNQEDAELFGVYTPDGTELYFCGGGPDGLGATWLPEFGVDHTPLTYGSISGVDHVTLAQPWHTLNEARLFFSSVLGLQAMPEEYLSSPAGLVYCQAMVGTNLDLVLTVAPEASEQGDFLAASYPEHITFATEDIIACAQAAVRRGLTILPVPANYYEDLAARYDLGEEYVATLQGLNILYDRDAGGQYLHFFTETVGLVYFEVAQRIGHYRGYGWPNAAVRLSAQYRTMRDDTRGIPH